MNTVNRRTFLGAAGALGLVSLTGGCATSGPAGNGPRVVVIGGGFGGATAAKYLRLLDPSLRVTPHRAQPTLRHLPIQQRSPRRAARYRFDYPQL